MQSRGDFDVEEMTVGEMAAASMQKRSRSHSLPAALGMQHATATHSGFTPRQLGQRVSLSLTNSFSSTVLYEDEEELLVEGTRLINAPDIPVAPVPMELGPNVELQNLTPLEMMVFFPRAWRKLRLGHNNQFRELPSDLTLVGSHAHITKVERATMTMPTRKAGITVLPTVDARLPVRKHPRGRGAEKRGPRRAQSLVNVDAEPKKAWVSNADAAEVSDRDPRRVRTRPPPVVVSQSPPPPSSDIESPSPDTPSLSNSVDNAKVLTRTLSKRAIESSSVAPSDAALLPSIVRKSSSVGRVSGPTLDKPLPPAVPIPALVIPHIESSYCLDSDDDHDHRHCSQQEFDETMALMQILEEIIAAGLWNTLEEQTVEFVKRAKAYRLAHPIVHRPESAFAEAYERRICTHCFAVRVGGGFKCYGVVDATGHCVQCGVRLDGNLEDLERYLRSKLRRSRPEDKTRAVKDRSKPQTEGLDEDEEQTTKKQKRRFTLQDTNSLLSSDDAANRPKNSRKSKRHGSRVATPRDVDGEELTGLSPPPRAQGGPDPRGKPGAANNTHHKPSALENELTLKARADAEALARLQAAQLMEFRGDPRDNPYSLDFEDESANQLLSWLLQFCILNNEKKRRYKAVFIQLDVERSYRLSIPQLIEGLGIIHENTITESQTQYVMAILKLIMGKEVRSDDQYVRFSMFCVMAALSERIVAQHTTVGKYLNKMDMKALMSKLEKARDMFLVNDTERVGWITLDALQIELHHLFTMNFPFRILLLIATGQVRLEHCSG